MLAISLIALLLAGCGGGQEELLGAALTWILFTINGGLSIPTH